MGKKDKKKGKGAEKTAAKTEKKALQKVKKELAAKGEDDIEKLIAEFQEEDRKRCHVGEEQCAPPTCRSSFTLCAHPDKDELLLFGGEYFNGSKTFMYNDLYIYNIKKDQWSVIQCPSKPPPRCSHQAVSLSQGGGQMWIFGGEFASPTRSQFYHYKDLWVFHIAERKWEQIKASGAPSSRSGHRMVVSRKKLLVFGGFHENVRDYKYFNDVHVFDLEKYQWSKIEPVGKVPSPRSGCQMAPLIDGRVVIYGGYCKQKVKKEVDQGITLTDMYILQFDDKSTKWKWIQIKQSGIHPSPRCGFSLALAPGDRAFLFGGVQDEEDSEETLNSIFYNDLYALELDRGRWLPIVLHGKQEKAEKKKRRKAKDLSDEGKDSESDEETLENNESQLENLRLSKTEENETVQIADDGVFTVKIGPQNTVSDSTGSSVCIAACANEGIQPFKPCPRMNASMVVKHSVLYLYGGLFEDGDKQITLADFYCLDLHKLDEWKTLISLNTESQEWIESEESEDDDDGSEEEDTAVQIKASDDESSRELEMDIS